MKNHILTTLILSFSILGVSAQTLDGILKKHFEAAGSKKLTEVKSLKMSTLTTLQGVQMDQVIYIKRPNKIRSEINMMGPVVVMIYDGENAYMNNPVVGGGFAPIYGGQAQSLVKRSDIDGPLFNYRKKGNKVKYLGKQTIDGKEYYKLSVIVTEVSDVVSNWYLDVNTYLLSRVEGMGKFQGTEANIVSVFTDYELVDGIAFFGRMTSSVDGIELLSMDIIDMEYNVDIDDNLFEVE